MPIRHTDKPEILAMKGMNLFHFSHSNCSMRIRLFFEEKGIPWNDRYVDIRKQENLTQDYFDIHPKGLVPAIVDDGLIVHESADILEYLEEKYAEPSFVPSDPEAKAAMDELLELTRSGHVPIIKTWVYGTNRRPTKTKESMEKYLELQNDEELIEFHKETLSDDFISEEKIAAAKAKVDAIFSDLDERLSKNEWILGDKMTLADIAWIPQYVTFNHNGFPFDDFPNFMAYVNRWKKRPSYQEAIVKYVASAA
jgi:glutathione S-transferase